MKRHALQTPAKHETASCSHEDENSLQHRCSNQRPTISLANATERPEQDRPDNTVGPGHRPAIILMFALPGPVHVSGYDKQRIAYAWHEWCAPAADFAVATAGDQRSAIRWPLQLQPSASSSPKPRPMNPLQQQQVPMQGRQQQSVQMQSQDQNVRAQMQQEISKSRQTAMNGIQQMPQQNLNSSMPPPDFTNASSYMGRTPMPTNQAPPPSYAPLDPQPPNSTPRHEQPDDEMTR
jgi:hypothetical protein